ncbi:MAG: OsmC family peroxiredoxin, partial [Lutibacter sp.]|nr:OsmC family peroxiredoxin [Lutibacter sp.]
KIYDKVKVIYKFYDKDFQKDKIEKAVNLSVEQYCGVMEMFRKFAEVSIEIQYIDK